MPRTAFAISAVGTGLVNLVISVVPLIAIVLFLKIPITAGILFLPVSMILLTCFSLGIGLLLSTMAVYFPDITEMYQIILLAWMYFTPVIYPQDVIPQAYRFWVFTFNPMYYLLRLFRMPIYDGVFPDWQTLLIGAGVSFVTLFVGWLIFARKADEFAYHA
jgi:ABC-type polysaccharide/polyol phosphate export permease